MNNIEKIAMLHKQNLNGRETDDELFEAGIKAGIEETEEKILRFAKWVDKNYFQGEKFNTYAKSKEDFIKKENVFTIEELFVFFNELTQAE